MSSLVDQLTTLYVFVDDFLLTRPALAWISHEGQGAQGSTLSERIWQNGRNTRM
jgi:hypothetical protein